MMEQCPKKGCGGMVMLELLEGVGLGFRVEDSSEPLQSNGCWVDSRGCLTVWASNAWHCFAGVHSSSSSFTGEI